MKTKTFSFAQAGVAGFIAIAIIILGTALLPRADAAGITTGGVSLEELIILDKLLDNKVGVTDEESSTLGLSSGLGRLLVLQSLFSGGVGLGGGSSVVVESGDTLSSIAVQYLGSASYADDIAAANGITNPDYITVGQVLTLPRVNTSGSAVGNSSLSQLILLDVLFNGEGDILGGEGGSNLEELIIINALFNGRAMVI